MKCSWLLFFGLLFFDCEDKIMDDRNPCKFADPQPNYSTYTNSNPDAFFKFQFRGKLYSFKGSQLEETGFINCGKDTCSNAIINYKNDFLDFRILRPGSEKYLEYSIGVKTPWVDPYTLDHYDSTEIPTSLIINSTYCRESYIADYVSPYPWETYNQFNTLELIKVYSSPGTEYFSADYWVTGEFIAQIFFEGQVESISGSYKVVISVYEKL